MARRKGFVASVAQYQREMAREQAARTRAHSAALREAERAQRAYERAVQADEKERKRLYLEARSAAVDSDNEELDQSISELESLLRRTLTHDDRLDFAALHQVAEVAPFQPGELAAEIKPPSQESYRVAALTFGQGLVPGAKKRHAEAVAESEERFRRDLTTSLDLERSRQDQLASYRRQVDEWNEAASLRAQARNEEIDAFRSEFEAGDPDAIVSYFDMVLGRSAYPDSFPTHYRIAYVPESKQLVVEKELPGVDVVPPVKSYRYVRTKDEIVPTPRAVAHVKGLYADVVAQVALRTVHEVFESDVPGHVETIVLNGYVEAVDPRTGKPVKPTLITLRTTRSMFEEIDLGRVDVKACLQHLGAGVSKSPTELAPVRPVLEFDMVDRRFIEETDVLSTLDQRPNLMEMSPTEFESLITNLFSKMGLEARQTQASRDGGVDCVAFDPRPIFGGKVVVQAKRYKGTVGVSAVRDLYGTMVNEGASKGILVTTSGYGAASHEFANGKPLELIDGTNLLYLLAEHAGVEAKIVPPDAWQDPTDLQAL